MSVVTSIVIITGCSGNMNEYLADLNAYLVEKKWYGFTSWLADGTEYFSERLYDSYRFKQFPTSVSAPSEILKYIAGNKAPEFHVIVGSFNAFPEYKDFIEYCKTQVRWRRKTIMILKHEFMDDFEIYTLYDGPSRW